MIKFRTNSIIITLLFLLLGCTFRNKNETVTPKESFRGVVLYPSDIRSLGVDRFIDILKKADIKVIPLGSFRLLIQKGLIESLAGRFETLHLGH